MIDPGGVDISAPPRSLSEGFAAAGLIWAAAFLIMAPELIAGPSYSSSFRYNFVWAGEFSRLILAGNPWPRWLPGMWDGLGSPTFYFYSPLYFWVVSAVRALGPGVVPVATATTAATMLILGASGIAMRIWLRGFANSTAALVGALAYMVGPYRIADIYARGALAEATAYVFLPLVMIALRRVQASRGATGVAGVALAYAGLILSHLPAALLASVTLMPITILWWAWRAGIGPGGTGRALLLRCAAGLLVGGGLAACYWLPALALRSYGSPAAMGGTFFNIERWFFWSPAAWPEMVPQASLTLASLLLALAAIASKGTDRAARPWIALILLSGLLISGALPFVWRLPGLREVQFAWRLLVVVEFATVTLLVIARPRLTHPFTIGGVVALAVSAGAVLADARVRMEAAWREGDVGRSRSLANMAGAPEYLPAGYPIRYDSYGRPDPGQFVPPDMPLALATDGHATVRARALPNGDVTIRVDASAPTRIVVRRFAFPAWVASGDMGTVATAPYGSERLTSWRTAAGSHEYRLHRVPTMPERLAWSITAASFGALLVLIALSLRGRKVP